MAGEWLPPILETERLRLRPVDEDDASALLAACSNPNLTRFTLFDPYQTVDDALLFIRHYARSHYFERIPDPLALTLRYDPNPRLVGTIGCRWVSMDDRVMELGYWLAEHLWGRGLMVEAGKALIAHVEQEYPVQRIQARVIAGNHASERVLEKLGFEREGVLRSLVYRREKFEDVVMYGRVRGQ